MTKAFSLSRRSPWEFKGLAASSLHIYYRGVRSVDHRQGMLPLRKGALQDRFRSIDARQSV